ncbi:DEAD/DEAH box helicase [Bacillus sp. JJ722]|uniref:DEAD/DEAH box helicase n=1 Tax=Bacillus sp. JJ722 TaxID=3122973 RepID=UPI002FFD71FA
MPDFKSIGISNRHVQKLKEMNIKEPTPIQEQAIPAILQGKDVIAQAQTGTGKTFAFILPILEGIDCEVDQIQALIVTPTRELAIQITNEVEKLSDATSGINVLAIYGGQDVEKQLKKLKRNVQIVVATPGRLIDHLQRQTVDLQGVSYLVLDEADQMLLTGFQNEVDTIIRNTSMTRQTLLFSATISDDVQKLAQKHLRNPQSIQIEKKQGPAENVEQLAIHLSDRAKQSVLIELVEKHRPFLAVIFCRTKRRVSKLYGELKSHGFACDELHSDISQAKRERVMKQFRTAKLQLLVATDVAARGLDVEGITHVYNYDIPEDSESYVHRIGRTGRAGMDGLAVTFYTNDDVDLLKSIEEELQIIIPKQQHESCNEKQTYQESDDSKPKRKKHYSRKVN